MLSEILISIGLGNGLIPVQQKGITEPMLTIVNWTIRNKIQYNLNENKTIFCKDHALGNAISNILFRFQYVKA